MSKELSIKRKYSAASVHYCAVACPFDHYLVATKSDNNALVNVSLHKKTTLRRRFCILTLDKQCIPQATGVVVRVKQNGVYYWFDDVANYQVKEPMHCLPSKRPFLGRSEPMSLKSSSH